MPSASEQASCKRKVRYSSDAAAQAALRKINPVKKMGKPARVYKCPVCSGWHLTARRKQ